MKDAGSDAAPPTLPVCNVVCDRVLDCGATTCVGIDWRTASLAQTLCDGACSPQFNRDVMAAADCTEVMKVVRGTTETLDMLCDQPLCVSACQHFAECTQQECPRYATQTTASIETACMGWCNADNAGGILSLGCGALVSSLNANDASFAASCDGSLGCADKPMCLTYGAKAAGCIRDHCDGNADAYESGLSQLLTDYCASAKDCPSPEAVAVLNDPAILCDDPSLKMLGPGAPFSAVCGGSVGATHAELLTACDKLIACGGMFASNELCAVFLAIGADTATKVTCVQRSKDCTKAVACL
jgi:hypothetical protein